ncbi:hypothetical protein A2334_03145 [Candidatus Roizmanbacteria bacterium RIFOXYB2_FULL_38_10]|uniref:DUF2207 domain-containing protein n=1 Tax=Candidatus Roizmanbacteria bacterium RIFOXYD1_FULL_38_12 TaxID=1802093 RepID=A0A1F7L1A6_9BACT|nr:MAG: hypothetical protein A3K47_03700 [Candidatus Roizmanbacteria bacterium RIFOXYA2_FULL_38_14]OGK63863.1 MAG: hypothetical protein A3K27_03700 [Candidatus Roizmanbacteria bacterium RIFOXYA1_FULL_37_12]OGK65709.1 MAG: hypothetical protein A3K38_03700 [Candidatus Roizmanbacteria bacterium RIFOXYB1_FULL_40_23]OGK67405.1 MAG: hypothetical protein A2334_03145 [Candidatus Roizmanbacteria bacterium RIFOXYB2_FULL_38_10]OGK70114.1 MAG: hypothetical protein A3K21_03705 [Candidatus Roizmanbacteria ba
MKQSLQRGFFFLAFSFLFTIFPNLVQAESINNFNTKISVQKDATIRVEERIEYDFGSLSKHGIYRDISTVILNQDGKKYRLEVQIVSVLDETGNPYHYTTPSMGGEILRIKIGDANRFVTGLKTYIITYQARGAMRYFSEHDELYWNMTGDKWDVFIENAQYEVVIPPDIPQDKIRVDCFTGSYGSTDKNCETRLRDNKIIGQITQSLSSHQGLTGVISLPPGFIAVVEPKLVVRFTDTIFGKIVMLIVAQLAFIWYMGLPFGIPLYWWMKGRDPKTTTGEVRAWFDPPKDNKGRFLTPSETGMLVDEKVDMKDIFAGVIDLARRGYFKLVEKKKGDFYFIREERKNDKDILQPFEKKLYDGIFSGGKDEVRLKDAKLVAPIEKVTTMLYEDMTAQGFFPHNPNTIRTIWYVIAGVALFTGNIFLAIVAFIFARVMPRKTAFGAGQANVGKSLKNFLVTQERQLEFQARNQMFFEKLLPYAVAFGVEKVWANRFKDIPLHNPDWYQGYDNHSFTTAYLLSSMHSSFSTFRSSATPVRSSTGHSSGFGGGGFSGGGGGGGGGGSW